MLSSRMDGVHSEGSASIPSVESINTHDPRPTSLQEVFTHPVASYLTRQLFKLPAIVPTRPVCIQPSKGPTFFAPNSSPSAEASKTVASDDEFLTACLQAFKCKHAALASQMVWPQAMS
jgi:hypothetical protein